MSNNNVYPTVGGQPPTYPSQYTSANPNLNPNPNPAPASANPNPNPAPAAVNTEAWRPENPSLASATQTMAPPLNTMPTSGPAPRDMSNAYGANRFWGSAPGFEQPPAPSEQARNRNAQGANQGNLSGAYPGANQKTRRSPGWLALIVVALLAALLSASASLGAIRLGWFTPLASPVSSQSSLFDAKDEGVTSAAPVVDHSTSQNPDWQAVAKAVRSAVVAIQVRSASGGGDEGSGFILDTKGHILTNNHVISAAVNGGQIIVSMSDGRLLDAQIVGRDEMTDLAVIKLKNPPSNLTVSTLGSDKDLQVGQAVAAIGNPLGLSQTVTTGIISALNRPVSVSSSGQPGAGGTTVTTNAIQVDASINPGNSGGPLFDAQGRVIGINSSIATLSESSGSSGSIGLGFAIPIDLGKMISKQLIEKGSASHAMLGVTVQVDTASVAGVTRLGARVVSVVPSGSADKAGIKAGDVIVAIDGNAVVSHSSLTGWVRRYPVGSEVTLDIVRDGKELQVKAVLAQSVDTARSASSAPVPQGQGGGNSGSGQNGSQNPGLPDLNEIPGFPDLLNPFAR